MSVAENLIYVDDRSMVEGMAVSGSDAGAKDVEQFLLSVPGLEPDSSFYNCAPRRCFPNEAALRAIIAKEPNPWKATEAKLMNQPDVDGIERFVLPPMSRSSFERISRVAEEEKRLAKRQEVLRERQFFDPVRRRMEYNMQRDSYFESMLAPLNNPEPEVRTGELVEEPLVEEVSERYNSCVYEAA